MPRVFLVLTLLPFACADGSSECGDNCVATQADARVDNALFSDGGSVDSNVLEQDAANSASCAQDLQNIDGESLFALSFSFALATPFQFVATTSIDSTIAPATIEISLQPLCAQVSRCVLGEYVGTPLQLAPAQLSEDCAFEANIISGIIPGSANPITGSDVTPDIVLKGSIETPELYCGTSTGTVSAPSTLPANGIFGAIPIATGTMGADLPAPRSQCDPNT